MDIRLEMLRDEKKQREERRRPSKSTDEIIPLLKEFERPYVSPDEPGSGILKHF